MSIILTSDSNGNIRVQVNQHSVLTATRYTGDDWFGYVDIKDWSGAPHGNLLSSDQATADAELIEFARIMFEDEDCPLRQYPPGLFDGDFAFSVGVGTYNRSRWSWVPCSEAECEYSARQKFRQDCGAESSAARTELMRGGEIVASVYWYVNVTNSAGGGGAYGVMTPAEARKFWDDSVVRGFTNPDPRERLRHVEIRRIEEPLPHIDGKRRELRFYLEQDKWSLPCVWGE